MKKEDAILLSQNNIIPTRIQLNIHSIKHISIHQSLFCTSLEKKEVGGAWHHPLGTL
jgi:hypothetical protein